MTSILQFKFMRTKEHNSLLAVGLFMSFLPPCLMAFKIRFSQFWKLPFVFKGGEKICLNLTYIWYCYHLWGLPDLVVFSVHFKYGKSILSVDFNSWGVSAVTLGLKVHKSNNQITQAGNIYMFIYSFTVTHKGCSYMWIGWQKKERAAILADNRWQTMWCHPKHFTKSPTPLMPFHFSWS